MNDLLINGPEDADVTIVLAHGAGAAMDTDFMNAFAEGLAKHHHRVIRFEFPYMAKRRRSGKKGPPDREPVLRAAWNDLLDAINCQCIVIGGKSMGGRMASLIADERKVNGLICLGYPFHPPGKPDRLRTEHLLHIQTPTLILQGERDPFGKRDEVSAYQLSKSVTIHWLTSGDHSLEPLKSSGRTREDNWQDGVKAAAAFVDSIGPTDRQ